MLRFAFSHMHNAGFMRTIGELVGRPQLSSLAAVVSLLLDGGFGTYDKNPP